MDSFEIDPFAAFRALQQRVAEEVARLYGEIAAKDAYIEQLKAALNKDDEVH